MSSGKYPSFPDANIDAFITDYVDGTMDDVTRRAFEELLEANPALKAEVCHMKEVRNFMCGLNCGCNLDTEDITRQIRTQVYQSRCQNGFSLPLWFKKEENIRLGIGVASISLVLLVLTGNAFFKREQKPKVMAASSLLSTHVAKKVVNNALPNKNPSYNARNICPSKKNK
jgi:hypothetical protein